VNSVLRLGGLRKISFCGWEVLSTRKNCPGRGNPKLPPRRSHRIIRHAIVELINKKIQPLLMCVCFFLLCIDEASLLRLGVFAELHTLCQFDADSKPHLPVILSGQNNLLGLLQYRSSLPLASRIVARSHLEGIDLEQMQFYLAHHLSIAGVKAQLFSPPAITAIQQASAGLLGRANHLARGALIAAANEKCQQVAAEHVRLAATELV
jgi:type II secretory pathway predicted ATPase ExeA